MAQCLVGSLVNLAAQKAEDDRRLEGCWLSSLAAKWGAGVLESVGIHVVLRSGTPQWCAMGEPSHLDISGQSTKSNFPRETERFFE